MTTNSNHPFRDLMTFDSRWGTDTDGEIPVEFLGHAPEIEGQAVSYEASDAATVRVIVDELPIERHGYTFVDLGSGKGRVVLLAAAAGFARAIGVEASATLHGTAQDNLRTWARAGNDGRDVEFVLADATRFELPADPCVLYLFNPFRERAFARLVLRIKWSLEKSPRDLWLIYYNPQCGYMLEKAPFLARVRVACGYPQGDYSIWRSHIV